jgi:hypothetical protein
LKEKGVPRNDFGKSLLLPKKSLRSRGGKMSSYY